MPASPIEPMLVLSTAHLTEDTGNSFLPFWSGPCWVKGEYGWFVYVTEDVESEPSDLIQCFAEARRRECCWIMFERDAPEIEELPTYEW